MEHIFDEAELLKRAKMIEKVTHPEWGRSRRSSENGQFARDMVTLTYLFENEAEARVFIETIKEVA